MNLSFDVPPPDRNLEGRAESLLDLFGPLVAGARARGVADAFLMLGLGAVLLDRTGRVLNVNAEAERLLAPCARIAEHHVVPATAEGRRELGALVEDVVGSSPSASNGRTVVLVSDDRAAAVRLRALRLPPCESAADQLLHAVLVVEPCTAAFSSLSVDEARSGG